MKKIKKFLVVAIVAPAIVYVAAALIMTFLPAPAFALDAFPAGTAVTTTEDKLIQLTMRDGESLSARQYTAESATTIVLLHAVTADSSQFNRSAEMLRAATGATTVAPDMRGHGLSGGASGDTVLLNLAVVFLLFRLSLTIITIHSLLVFYPELGVVLIAIATLGIDWSVIYTAWVLRSAQMLPRVYRLLRVG